MTRRLLLWGIAAPSVAAAQTAVPNAAVSGTVKDKITGQPLANYTVATSVKGRQKEATVTTDSSGRYKLADLPPGTYRIAVRNGQHFGRESVRRTEVNGADVEKFDFPIVVPAIVSGKVVDENKEPVPDVMVRLIKREYYLGNVSYYYTPGGNRTNDLGEFTIEGVEPGRPYFLLAEKANYRLLAHSEVPLNPKLRKRVPVRTWYPNSAQRESAEALILRPGEKREGIDIELKKSPSYCVEGIAAGATGPSTMHLNVEATPPSNGSSSSGASYSIMPNGPTEADGRFRVCDLYSGVYRFSVQEGEPNAMKGYGAMEITVVDQDLTGVRLNTLPAKTLAGEVMWDADPPATPVSAKAQVSINPLFRTGFLGGRQDVPGPFTIEGVFADEYAVRVFFNAPGIYVKDVTFADRSVMYEALRPATAMGEAGLRVVMARDGATLSVQVNDKDGNPGVDLWVLTIPAEVRSEGELAARMEQGQTDQTGSYTTQSMPPGKYYVVAVADPVDPTPESIGLLWLSRNRYQEVTLPPSGSVQVKLQPGKIE